MSEMKKPESGNTPQNLNEIAKDYSTYKSIDWHHDPAGEQFLHVRFSEQELAIFKYARTIPLW
jgi:hypothetical protein